MTRPKQGPSKSGRETSGSRRQAREPESPAFDKKLDGPNRPST